MILDDIVEKKKIRIENHKKKIPLEDMKAKAERIVLEEKSDKDFVKIYLRNPLKKMD